MATATFGEQGVLATQLHARGVHAVFRVAFAVDAHVAGDNAAHHAVFIEQRFLGGEARVDFHAQVLGLLGQPAAQVAQRDDVVALVVHGLGHEQVRHLGRTAGILEHVDVVALHFGVQRRAELFPVWEQLVQGTGLEHRAGEDVGADFRAFFHHADADFATGFGGLLLQAAGGGQARRAGADDDHVEFHVFAFHWFSPTHQGSCCCFVLWVRGAFAAVLRNGGTVAGQMTDYTVLSWPRIISTPLGGSNTNVCLNLPQASKITGTRLEGDRFAVLTGLGVTVKIRAVLRSP
ncbi:hypothetical protein D3C78_987240 [compost metagenome]